MNGYTSGKRAEIDLPLANHDPKPFVQDGTSWPPPLTLKPRRKFDVPENPILVRFRKQKSRTARQFLAYTFEQGAALHRLYGLDALIHARRVIDKLS